MHYAITMQLVERYVLLSFKSVLFKRISEERENVFTLQHASLISYDTNMAFNQVSSSRLATAEIF